MADIVDCTFEGCPDEQWTKVHYQLTTGEKVSITDVIVGLRGEDDEVPAIVRAYLAEYLEGKFDNVVGRPRKDHSNIDAIGEKLLVVKVVCELRNQQKLRRRGSLTLWEEAEKHLWDNHKFAICARKIKTLFYQKPTKTGTADPKS